MSLQVKSGQAPVLCQRNRDHDTHQIEIERDVWHKGPEPKIRKTVQVINHRNQVT